MDDGLVKPEHKEGNDGADEGADLGATSEQQGLSDAARKYARRQCGYKQFMTRVHAYIIHLRKTHRAKVEENEKTKNPLGEKNFDKQIIPTTLAYHDPEDRKGTENISTRRIAEHDEEDPEERRQTEMVRCFLDNIRWKTHPLEVNSKSGGTDIWWLDRNLSNVATDHAAKTLSMPGSGAAGEETVSHGDPLSLNDGPLDAVNLKTDLGDIRVQTNIAAPPPTPHLTAKRDIRSPTSSSSENPIYQGVPASSNRIGTTDTGAAPSRAATAIETTENKNERGGITWVELYVYFILHGGGVQIEELKKKHPLMKTISLQSAIASLKKRCDSQRR